MAVRVTFSLPSGCTYCLWLVFSDVNYYSSLDVKDDRAFKVRPLWKWNKNKKQNYNNKGWMIRSLVFNNKYFCIIL